MPNLTVPAAATGLPTSIFPNFGHQPLTPYAGALLLLAEDATEARETTQHIGAIIARLTGLDARSAVRS